MDTLATMDSGAPASGGTTLPRRAALGGIAATVGGALAAVVAGRASAQETDTTVAETTTVPPRLPTGDDVELLAFANSAELATVRLYATALATGAFSEDNAHIMSTFADHHRQYAAAIAGLLSSDAPNVANATLVEELTGAFSVADEAALIEAAYELESALAATHTTLFGLLKGVSGAALVASIQPVEARQSVVLGRAVGMAIEEVVPEVQPTDGALDPAEYPVDA